VVVPPSEEILATDLLMEAAHRDPEGPEHQQIKTLLRSAHAKQPSARSNVEGYLVDYWRKPRGPFPPRGRGSDRGRGAPTHSSRGRGGGIGPAHAAAPFPHQGGTGLMPQPGVREPLELQHAYYRQHPQAIPRWVTGGSNRTFDALTADQRAMLDAWHYIRRIAPERKDERRAYMDIVQGIFSGLATFVDWHQSIRELGLVPIAETRVVVWPANPTFGITERTVRAHLAEQGFTAAHVAALVAWARAATPPAPPPGTSGTTSSFSIFGSSYATGPNVGPGGTDFNPFGVPQGTPDQLPPYGPPAGSPAPNPNVPDEGA
jgi:hypothetical protein